MISNMTRETKNVQEICITSLTIVFRGGSRQQNEHKEQIQISITII